MTTTRVKRSKSAWKDHWHTPKHILDLAAEILGDAIALDPATDKSNPTNASKIFTPEDNGLLQEWENKWFLNPPFSSKHHWLDKAVDQGRKYTGVAIVPAACQHNKGTRALVQKANLIACLGRVKFEVSEELRAYRVAEGLDGSPEAPPDDMLLLYFGPGGRYGAAIEVLQGTDYPIYWPMPSINFEEVQNV